MCSPSPKGALLSQVGYAVFASYLYPAFELVMSNELLGQTAFIKPLKIDIEPYPIPGAEVMAHFGYETGECSRLLGEEGGCAYTLGALAENDRKKVQRVVGPALDKLKAFLEKQDGTNITEGRFGKKRESQLVRVLA